MTSYINIIATIIASFAIGLVGKIVFDWLKNKDGNGKFIGLRELINEVGIKEHKKEMLECFDNVKWIKDIHNKTDAEGLPLWYIPREWKKTLDVVKEKSIETNIYLKDIRDTLKTNAVLLKELIDKI